MPAGLPGSAVRHDQNQVQNAREDGNPVRSERKALVTLALTVSSSWLLAQPLPEVAPEDAGLAPTQLDRVEARLQEGVDAGELLGAVTLVARHGQVAYFNAVGE